MSESVSSALLDRRMELGPHADPQQPQQRRWQHWRLARDQQDIAWLLMDKAESSTNVLSEEVLLELGEVLEHLRADLPQALVLRSAKAASFCVGADISAFRQMHHQRDVINKLSDAHIVAQGLADLPCPTIAVIHGAALGGGLELALCCDYRLALSGASFGLPEVLLGLHPGLGGTARLPALIHPLTAMQMMLTGKNTHDRKALDIGLIDEIVEEHHLAAAIQAVTAGRRRQQRRPWHAQLFVYPWVRRLVAKRMRAQAAKQAPPQHYPAPEALITLWEKHASDPDNMLHMELLSFARLINTPTSRNLVRLFFLREKLKGLASGDKSSAKIRHLHVVGAGAMGGDIASWCALQGLRVSLADKEPKALAEVIGKTRELCRKKHLSGAETRSVLDRLIPDPHNHGAAQADLVLEAVSEDLDLKRQLYAELEPMMKPDALLASNTSSIKLESLSEGLQRPERFVGIHFFNPVAQMQLVEVVAHGKARKAHLDRARAFVGAINRLVAPVSSTPGFLVNRVLTPYLVEAICLLDEGVAAEAIDQKAIDFGMPMGPIELADQVGLDICLNVAEMLRETLDNHQPETPEWLRKKVEQGHLGKKSGRGLYRWKNGKPVKKSRYKQPPKDTLDRLLLPMLNACAACLREEVVADSEVLDGALVFATGFAPFRGGPVHYAQERGIDEVVTRLRDLEEEHGPRFAPDSGWQALAQSPAPEEQYD
ncbi:MAG: 3-hydroxyacyl-CoA dehydrogenase NAD-binding domain-containing protein [Pseudomonas sp.]